MNKNISVAILALLLCACQQSNQSSADLKPESFKLKDASESTVLGDATFSESVDNVIKRPIANYNSPDRQLASQLILHEPPSPKAENPTPKHQYVGFHGHEPIQQNGISNRALQVTIDAATTQTNIDNTGSLFIPADPHGAAGPNHVVNVVNTSIEIYNKDGTGASSQSLQNFFAAVTPVNFTFDPKVIYDQFEDRFVVVTLERVDGGTAATRSSAILLAVSDDSNPNGTWYTTRIDVTEVINGVQSWLDYPGFSVDEEVIYITGNMFGFSPTSFQANRLLIIEKGVTGGFYDNNTAVVSISDPIPGGAFGLTMQPAHAYGTPAPANLGTYLTGYSGLAGGANDFLQVIRVDNPTGTPTFTASFINMGDVDNITGALTDAPQSGTATLVSVNDRRTLNAVMRGDQIWTAATVNAPAGTVDAGQTTAAWVELSGVNTANIALQDFGYVGGEDIVAGAFTFFPAVAVNSDGGLAIGFSVADGSIFPSSYFTVRSPGDAAGTTRGSVLIKAGTDFYERTFGGPRNRWGDYTSTVVDPNDACFWMYNKHAISRGSSTGANDDGRWGTAHAQFCNSIPSAGTDALSLDNGATATELTNSDTSLLENDSDADGFDTLSMSTTAATAPNNGSVTLNTNGTFSYTHDGSSTTSDSFQYTVCDDGSPIECAIGTVNVTIAEVPNTAPTANAQNVNVDEDDSVNITLTGSDNEGDNLTFTVATQPAEGSLSGTPPNLIYAPDTDYNGSDSFTFTVNDGTVDSASATISITVDPINDQPTATAQSLNTDEDIALNITLAGNDIDGDNLTFSVASGPANGSISGTPPNITYTPSTDFNGNDSFTFVANDGTVNSSPATISIAVAAQNDQPTATAQSVNVDEDDSVNITLAGNDVDGDNLTFTVASQPTDGSLSGTPPNLTYAPDTDFNGSDSFTFTVNDGTVDSVAATVSITIDAANDQPTATAQSLNTNEDIALNITLAGNDIDGDNLTFSVASGPSNGSISGTPPNITYTPNTDFNGNDSFTFVANDGTVNSSAATINIAVAAQNDQPTATAQSVNVDEDDSVNITLAGNDVDGDNLTFTVASQPTDGSLSGTPPNLIYAPDSDFNGSDSFTFTVNDGTVDSASATISITIDAANDQPTATAQSLNTDEDTALNITLAGNDIDGDGLTFSVASGPANGSISGTPPNITYTPNTDFNGNDSFTFVANDGTVNSSAATISIAVAAQNDQPTATAQSVNVDEDDSVNITLAGNDVDGDNLTFTVASQPTDGSLSGTPPNLIYAPDSDFNGSDSFTFTVNDGTVDSASATISITIDAANDQPTATAQSLNTNEDTALNITLAGNDIDGDGLTFSVASGPANGSISGTPPNITYTPGTNFNGNDSFTFVANDGTVDSNAATISITVDPQNDQPTATAQSVNVDEDDSVNITLAGNDVDGDGITFSLVSNPANGSLSGTPPNLTYAPDTDYNGSDSFTFTVNDGTVDSVAATVSITVDSVNDRPTANNQNLNTNEDTDLNIVLSGNDIDGDSLSFTVTSGPANGSISGTPPNITYTPAANFNGNDSFSYVSNDGSIDSLAAIVNIDIASVNDQPIADAQNVNVNEDDSVNITLTGSDIDGDGLTFVIDSGPANGSLSGTPPNLIYAPDAGFNGSDSFTFLANDGALDSVAATVNITIDADNDTPTAVSQLVNTDEDTAVNITLTGNDVDGDSLTFSVVTGPSNGSLSGSAPNLIYTPDANFNGSDSFTFVANDGQVDSLVATIDIDIAALNDFPTTVTDSYDLPELQTSNISSATGVLANDSDVEGSSLTAVLVNDVSNGTLVLNADGSFTYTPSVRFPATDSFTYRANDGSDDSVETTVTINVTDVIFENDFD
ncbi:Ig-like domain-containing protein [Marinicella sp. W31]|uniref:Ig-like domain-containing protein n=1 Tax=Marinicella sp. W31 TaxID=3023713 RepID=UPI003756A0F2